MFEDFMLGVNYWPRHRGVKMWKEWSSSEVEEEFREIKELGLKVVRVFLLWPDFQPQEDYIDDGALSLFEELVSIGKKNGLKIAPTFFVGNMSGEVFDPPWRKGRNVYKNPSLLNAQISLVKVFAERYKEDDSIIFWDLSNEPDLAFAADSAEDVRRWNRLLYQEIKKYDSTHPITLGLHQGSLFEDNKFRPQELALYNDFISIHAYPIYSTLCPDSPDSLRSTYFPSFLFQLVSALTAKKVLVEEFGVSSQLMSEEQQRRYYESVLFSLLCNGALGALAWCFSDFSQDESSPYNSTPYEVGFGVTTKEGREKPSAEVVKKISVILEKGNLAELSREEAKAGIITPRYYHNNPDKDITPEIVARALFSSYLLAKQAGVNVDFISLDQELKKYHLILLPSIPRRGALTVKDWHKIIEYVRSGGIAYCSYHGVAFQELEDLFGISLKYVSEVEPGTVDFVSTGERSLPQEITIKAVKSRRLLLQDAEEVWMRDQFGEIAVASRHYGKGRTIFFTYPVELYLSYMADVFVGNLLYRVYEEIAREAELLPTPSSGNPSVESRIFFSNNRQVFFFVNHRNKKVLLKLPRDDRNVWYKDLYSDEIISEPVIVLQGNQGKVLEVIKGVARQ